MPNMRGECNDLTGSYLLLSVVDTHETHPCKHEYNLWIWMTVPATAGSSAKKHGPHL
jgi:hypothetical protein